jgi:thiamine biosynthesis lipoprotein
MSLLRFSFHALGTRCHLQCAGVASALAERWACASADLLRAREARWSRFRADSLIGRINAQAGDGAWHVLDPEDEALLDWCDGQWRMSAGAFDPTVLPLCRLWAAGDPDPEALAATRDRVGWQRVERRPGAIRLPLPGMGIDLGGAGKEWLADRVLALADDCAIDHVLVDLGGDLAVRGHPPQRRGWRIGLADPENPANHWSTIDLAGGAVATSGHSHRSVWRDGRRLVHLLDPRSGRPADTGVEQVTVFAGTCAVAGGLASRACLETPDAALALLQAAGVRGVIHGRGLRFAGDAGAVLNRSSESAA